MTYKTIEDEDERYESEVDLSRTSKSVSSNDSHSMEVGVNIRGTHVVYDPEGGP